MTTLPIEDLASNLGELIARVEAGETVLLERDGKTVAQVSPCDPRAVLERTFPGMTAATRSPRDLRTDRVPLASGPDIVDVLLEVRNDRDLLP